MNTELLLACLEYVIIGVLLFAIIFTLGVVWRTEKKLDLTYKLLLVALVAFFSSRILGLGFWLSQEQGVVIVTVLDFFGFVFLLLSILEMRAIVRFLDKETSREV